MNVVIVIGLVKVERMIPEDPSTPIKSDDMSTVHRWWYNVNIIVNHVGENEEEEEEFKF
jgi:hypothetical protein